MVSKVTTLIVAVVFVVVIVPLALFGGILGGDDDNCGPGGVAASDTAAAGSAVRSATGTVQPMEKKSYQYTDYFGTRGGQHQGVDMGAPAGTPIYAYADGVVNDAGPANGFGHWIVLDHNVNGKLVSTVYGHMYADGLLVKTGQRVKAGQHIANVGSDGGSTGPHLHFEYWPGGRHGGAPIDPKPLVDAAPDPRGGGTANPSSPAADAVAAIIPPAPPSTPATTPPAAPAVPSDGELPPMPKSKGSEEHWQIDTIRLARAVAVKFPQVKTIGGWRPYDAYPDHPSGRAADIMIPNYASAEGKRLGDAINAYILANKKYFQVEYTIWRQTYHPASGPSNLMEDRGSDTQNHFDHVHATTIGHGFPNAGTRFGGAPDGGGDAGSAPAAQCVGGDVHGGEDTLGHGKVPAEFEPWLRKAGTLCKSVSSSLLAAQLEQESGFRTDRTVVSDRGAMGPAQFMPDTWPGWGKDDDGNGRVDPFDVGDAVMAQGRFMCAIAKNIDPAVDSGRVSDDYPGGRPALYLAGYNAGEQAVIDAGGMPSGGDYSTQTRPYADKILSREPAFRGQLPDAA